MELYSPSLSTAMLVYAADREDDDFSCFRFITLLAQSLAELFRC